MSIQYVTVRVDTMGLFQPLTAAQGVVGVIGPAVRTPSSTRNPELFTQPLVGARSEPYARVVRVLPVSNAAEPLDAAGNPVGGSGNNLVDSLGRDPDANGNPVTVPGLKIDVTGGFVGDDGATPVAVDRATNRPRRFDGALYQLTYRWFPPAEQPAAAEFGVPVDGRGRPIPDLRMDSDGAFTSLDGQTQFPVNPATGYPERPAAGGNPPHPITSLDYGLGDVARAVNLALVNGATRAWAFRTDRAGGAPTTDDGFADFANRQLNVVFLANNTTAAAISNLRDHVEAASPNDAGGGGIRPRIGVAMLPREGWTSNGGNPQPSQRLSDFGIDWTSSRMVLVAHKSRDDVAAAVAGRIVRYDPWISVTMKEVTGISQTDRFSDSEIAVWLDPEAQGITQARVNPIIDPEFLPGAGLVLGESYTADGTGQRLYIDIVRTIDDLAFRLKANLTNPNVIGTMRINRPGLTGLRTLVSALLDARVTAGEIDSYTVDIPLLAILQKDPAQRTPEETQQINDVQNSRRLEFSVSVDYAGAIHYLIVTLRFV
jgi:hypothetical protein